MDRRKFLRVLTGSAVGVPLAADAQPARTIPIIGYLGPPASVGGFLQAFQQGLQDLGLVEGQNIHVEYRYNVALQGNQERLVEMATELVKLRPEVIVVSLAEVALAAKQATSTIPIVMANVADPVAAGLVASLARPGGNVTGVSRQSPEIVAKQIQLLKEAFPRITRIGVMLNNTDRLHKVIAGVVEETARSLGMQVSIVSPNAATDIEGAFAALRADRVGAVLVGDGGVLFLTRAQIADLALKDRIPSVFGYREPINTGGLMAYGASSVANYRRAAYFVDRILKGAKPADLPVEQSPKFELVINLKTAKVLGVTIPQAILLRADEVIQ
jgi:putative ABC transport system substrate-binding protein